jgi:hypothetical protein
MHQMDQKKLLIERILPYLTGAPADAVQRLLQKSVSDLEQILDDAITKKARAQAAEQVTQHADEMRRESQLEGAWTHGLLRVDKWQTLGARTSKPRPPGIVAEPRRGTECEALYSARPTISPALRLVITTDKAKRRRTPCRLFPSLPSEQPK